MSCNELSKGNTLSQYLEEMENIVTSMKDLLQEEKKDSRCQEEEEKEVSNTGDMIMQLLEKVEEMHRSTPDGVIHDADTILADLLDNNDFHFIGISTDIFSIYKNSTDKQAVAQMFYEFTGMEFHDYLEKCKEEISVPAITEFKGEYAFLSNFYHAPVTFWGHAFKNTESAFQAAKCPERMQEFCGLNPSEAKRLGRSVKLRSDWEEVKEEVMYLVCKSKFTQNSDLRQRLIATGNAELIEGNTWGDRIWGVCNGTGKNRLGKILMQIREELTQMQKNDMMP